MLLHNQYEFDPNTDLIGHGGFARVYKAYDKNNHIFVALKRYEKRKDTKYTVLNEIRRCLRFRHDNIIGYLNCFQVENTNSFGEIEVTEFGVMEYADAGDFSQLINKKVKISIDELKEIVIGILDGLHYLHTPNPMHNKKVVIHRDLKASNILFTRIQGKLIPKICDFGISKEIVGQGTVSTGLGFLGTVEYMAPEQFNFVKFGQNGELQPNADLWAFGCMLYEYFTGKAPFGKRTDGDLQIDIQENIEDQEPKYPSSIPSPFIEVIKKCLVKNAANRVADANTLKLIISGAIVVKEDVPIGKPEDKDKCVLNKHDKSLLKTFAYTIFILIVIFILFYNYKAPTDGTDVEETIETTDSTGTEEAINVATEAVNEARDAASRFNFINSAGESFSYNGVSQSGGIDANGNNIYTPDGKGIAVYSNGDKYEGEFVYGIREGNGKYYWKDGEKFEGTFKNNKRNGFGKYYDAKGSLIEQGNYINGELKDN